MAFKDILLTLTSYPDPTPVSVVEEAVSIRDRLLTAFDEAAGLEPGPRRRRLLTITFVGERPRCERPRPWA